MALPRTRARGAGREARRVHAGGGRFGDLAALRESLPDKSQAVEAKANAKAATAAAAAAAAAAASKEAAAVRVQQRTVKGKRVCVVDGLVADEREVKDLAKRLKKACATGVKVLDDTSVQVQGPFSEAIVDAVRALGYADVKRSGG